jgi:hypothetical protein
VNELIAAYTEIIKNEPELEKAQGHLMNFLLDAQVIAKAVEDAVTAAKQRAATQ